MNSRPSCWCKTDGELVAFGGDYLRCPACGTLVSGARLEGHELEVRDDEASFYGRTYWFEHQTRDYGHPSIVDRARTDVPVRCVHWLRTLLRYKVPPGTTLELGSAHGGFVSMLRMVGFDAAGLEMSPAVAKWAAETFDVPVLVGPVEDQQSLKPQSYDVIVMMDVLEHLPDPESTLRRCAELLGAGGFLLIQTPGYRGAAYEDLLARDDLFLSQLKAIEHIYLYSRESVQKLLEGAGLRHVHFEQPIFPYDMFLVAGRTPFSSVDDAARDAALEATPGGRWIRAISDLYERKEMFERAADERLRTIEALDAKLQHPLLRAARTVRRLVRRGNG